MFISSLPVNGGVLRLLIPVLLCASAAATCLTQPRVDAQDSGTTYRYFFENERFTTHIRRWWSMVRDGATIVSRRRTWTR